VTPRITTGLLTQAHQRTWILHPNHRSLLPHQYCSGLAGAPRDETTWRLRRISSVTGKGKTRLRSTI
ncbi:hypothetical protein TNCV_2661881, partial [Trichonephila clavipes]